MHEFRIARLYLPGKESQSGCVAPTESETGLLVKHFTDMVARRLERDASARQECPEGCRCIYNGRFSEWSEWADYSNDRVEVVAKTTRDGTTCEWKLRGSVRVRYRKRLGDCFGLQLPA